VEWSPKQLMICESLSWRISARSSVQRRLKQLVSGIALEITLTLLFARRLELLLMNRKIRTMKWKMEKALSRFGFEACFGDHPRGYMHHQAESPRLSTRNQLFTLCREIKSDIDGEVQGKTEQRSLTHLHVVVNGWSGLCSPRFRICHRSRTNTDFQAHLHLQVRCLTPLEGMYRSKSFRRSATERAV
jgi:hypothetical protein